MEKGLIEELAQPVPGERALDLGCGTGSHTLWLAGKGLVVTGLDESRTMLEVAAAKPTRPGVRVGFVRGDVVALPFESGQFDLVVSVAAAEFVPDRHTMLREAKRVLKPGGRLVLGLLTRDSAWGELYRREGTQRTDSVFTQAHLFTERELPSLLGGPFVLRKGLYHPPRPDLDPELAVQLEHEGQARQGDGAGFFALRWVKQAP